MVAYPTHAPLDVIAIGAINLDYLSVGSLDVSRFRTRSGEPVEKGTELWVDDADIEHLLGSIGRERFRPSVGGSAFNVVRTLHGLGLGLRLGLVGVAGAMDEVHDLPPQLLDAWSVDTEHLVRPADPAGRCVAIHTGQERTLRTSSGANSLLTDMVLQPEGVRNDRLVSYLSRARVIHVTSLFDQDVVAPALVDLLTEVWKQNPTVLLSVDPGHVWAANLRGAVFELVKTSHYILVNESEFRLLAQKAPKKDNDRKVARCVFERLAGGRSAQAVVLLKKRIGATAFTGPLDDDGLPHEHRYRRLPIPSWRVKDSTAAGDVFAAGVLATVASPRLRGELGIVLGTEAARIKLRKAGAAGYKLGDAVRGLLGRNRGFRMASLVDGVLRAGDWLFGRNGVLPWLSSIGGGVRIVVLFTALIAAGVAFLIG